MTGASRYRRRFGAVCALLTLAAVALADVAVAASSQVTAKAHASYSYSSVADGVAYGGIWRNSQESILQADGSGRVDFPLLVFKRPSFGNFTYSGEFSIQSGNEDRYAGFVFRLRDPRDYYAVRFSASENNIFFARFDNGSRTVLASFDSPVAFRHWEKIRLVALQDVVTIYLDGKTIGTVKDDKWLTGMVGLNTKSDSVTRFRNIVIEADSGK
jgi:hypothetical protein